MATFTISDLSFKVTQSTLAAYILNIGPRILWGVEVTAEPDASSNLDWYPRLEGNLFHTVPGEVASWVDFSGRSLQWAVSGDTSDVPTGFLNVFDHYPMSDNQVEIERNDSGELSLRWAASCNVYYDDQYYDNLPFVLDVPLTFVGIWGGRKPEKECREQMAPFFPQEDFRYTQTEHGVSLLVPDR